MDLDKICYSIHIFLHGKSSLRILLLLRRPTRHALQLSTFGMVYGSKSDITKSLSWKIYKLIMKRFQSKRT